MFKRRVNVETMDKIISYCLKQIFNFFLVQSKNRKLEIELVQFYREVVSVPAQQQQFSSIFEFTEKSRFNDSKLYIPSTILQNKLDIIGTNTTYSITVSYIFYRFILYKSCTQQKLKQFGFLKQFLNKFKLKILTLGCRACFSLSGDSCLQFLNRKNSRGIWFTRTTPITSVFF